MGTPVESIRFCSDQQACIFNANSFGTISLVIYNNNGSQNGIFF